MDVLLEVVGKLDVELDATGITRACQLVDIMMGPLGCSGGGTAKEDSAVHELPVLYEDLVVPLVAFPEFISMSDI